MSQTQTIGYPRDASWWDNPDVRSPKRLHRMGVDGLMAACDSKRIMLCPDMGHEVTANSACRRCWPRDRSVSQQQPPGLASPASVKYPR